MKRKKLLVIVVTTILAFSFLLTSVWAGPTQRHRWEGVAIGIGAAILGSALFDACYYSQPRPAHVCYSPPPVTYYSSPPVIYYSTTIVRPGPPPRSRHGHLWPRHWRRHGCW